MPSINELLAEIEALKTLVHESILNNDQDEPQPLQADEDTTELILYQTKDSETPVEITWTEKDTETKQEYYRTLGYRRTVIGKLQKP